MLDFHFAKQGHGKKDGEKEERKHDHPAVRLGERGDPERERKGDQDEIDDGIEHQGEIDVPQLYRWTRRRAIRCYPTISSTAKKQPNCRCRSLYRQDYGLDPIASGLQSG